MAGYSVTIKAVDQATATVERINAKIAGSFKKTNEGIGRVTAPVTRFADALGKLGNTVGLDKVARGLGAVGRGLAQLPGMAMRAAGTLARVVPALGAITGAASLAGMAALISRWAEFGQQLGFTSQRLGVGVEQLGALQGAARLAGSSSEAMTGGLRGLQQTMQDAAGGRNAEAVVLFNKLGVSFRDADGNARSVTDALPELADKIAGIKNPQLQAMVATQLFGSSAEALLPLLREGSAGLAKYQDEARKYGLVSGQGAEAARGFAKAQTHLMMAVEGLGNKVAEKLAPILLPLLDKMALWIAAHGDEIANWFGGVATKLSEWVNNGGVQALMERLEAFGTKVNEVVQFFGGWETAALALGVVLGASMLLPLTGIVAKMAMLTAIKPAAWMLRLLGVGGSLSAGVAIAGGVAAHKGLNAVDPEDKLGAWIDKNVPGASWVDNQASRIGLGRSYGEQARIRREDEGKDANPGGPVRRGNARPHGGPSRNTGAATSTFDTTMSPQARGLLDTIAGTESPGYNVMYGGRRFTDMSQHPNVAVPITSGPNAGQTSSAAGRYQFLKSTWDEASGATGVRDFSPASQDKNGWWLAQRDYNKRTGRDLAADLKSNDPRVKAGIGQALHGTWTSLPGGIEAGTNDSKFSRQLDAAIGRNQLAGAGGAPAAGPLAPGPVAPGIAQAAAASGANGRVAVDVTHRGDPGNTNVRVSASGAAEQDKLRIERTPLLAGTP